MGIRGIKNRISVFAIFDPTVFSNTHRSWFPLDIWIKLRARLVICSRVLPWARNWSGLGSWESRAGLGCWTEEPGASRRSKGEPERGAGRGCWWKPNGEAAEGGGANLEGKKG